MAILTNIEPNQSIRPDWIPAEKYVGTDVPAREKTKLWPRVWQMACREEEIPNVGDFVNYVIQDESIVIVRIAPGKIKAVYNVCQHRGRRLLDTAKGNIESTGFVCRFHGWRWRIDGTLAYVHCRDDWTTGLSDDELALKEPRVDTWGGWVWINQDRDAVSLTEWLGPIPDMMKNFELEGLRLRWYNTLYASVNWKVFTEAFNEGYHSGATHDDRIGYHTMRSPSHAKGMHSMYFTIFDELPRVKKDGVWKRAKSWPELLYLQLLELHEKLFAQVLDPAMAAVTRLYEELPDEQDPGKTYARFFELHREEVLKTGAPWPEKLTLEDLGAAGTGWHIFPNMILLPSPDGVLYYRFRPDGDDPDRCITDIWCLERVPEGGARDVEQNIVEGFDAFRGSNPFLEEDFDNMIAVNKGMKSAGWRGAKLNPAQESTIMHFHQTLEAFQADK